MKSSAAAAVWRIRFLAVLVLIYSAVLGTKLFYLQIVKNQHYRDQADRQYLRPATGIFDRGEIYFQTKNGELVAAATVKTGFTVAINPKLIKGATTTYEQLATVFSAAGENLDRENFLARAAKSNDPYEEVADRAGEAVAQKIREQKLKGVIISKDRWRYYPASSTAAHVIGLMGYKGDEYTGRYGLENYYNEVLSRNSKPTFTNFFAEIYRGISFAGSTTDKMAEGDLVLTIEPRVQKYLETTLEKTADRYQSEMVGGIIIDPRTGEIAAMAAWPNFQPGEKQQDLSVLPNPLIEGRYEMGSIIKALTMAIGLDTGTISAETTYEDTGCITLNTKLICNYDGKRRGIISMQEVLSQSLNVGVTFIGQQVGNKRFRDYFRAFGLEEKTTIDLPGEITGSLSTLNNDQAVEFATAAFGQGISLTPIATTRALSSLANGGYLISPHVVKEIRYGTGLRSEIEPSRGRQVISTTTSREITRMLVEVVDTKLANGQAKLPHTSVAAKTGTAQYVDPETKKYYPDRYLHSFFGYFPAYDPEFLVFLMIKHPKNVQYASETLTEPFLDITKFLINYYQIPPDR